MGYSKYPAHLCSRVLYVWFWLCSSTKFDCILEWQRVCASLCLQNEFTADLKFLWLHKFARQIHVHVQTDRARLGILLWSISHHKAHFAWSPGNTNLHSDFQWNFVSLRYQSTEKHTNTSPNHHPQATTHLTLTHTHWRTHTKPHTHIHTHTSAYTN